MKSVSINYTLSLVICIFVHSAAQLQVSGPPGPPGQPGTMGEQGPPGDPGTRGARGLRGIPGRPGLNGMMGLKGPNGHPGTVGPQGTGGPRGTVGPKGPEGNKGQPGPPGKPGSPSNHYHHYVKPKDDRQAEPYQCACSGVSAAVNSLQLSVQQTAATQSSLMLQLTTLQHTLSYHLTVMSRHIARLSSTERCSQGTNKTSYPSAGHPVRYDRLWPLMNGWYPWKWKPRLPVKTHPHMYTTETTTVKTQDYSDFADDDNDTNSGYSSEETKPYNEGYHHHHAETTAAYNGHNDPDDYGIMKKPHQHEDDYKGIRHGYKHTTPKPYISHTTIPTEPTKRQGCYVGLIAWYAGRCTGWKAPRNSVRPHLLPMEEEYVNFGSAYNLDESTFVAPANGYYIISYSIGANLRESANVTLTRTTTDGQYEALSDLSLASTRGRSHIAVDTVSKSLLLSLRTGDVLKLCAHNKTFLYSDDHNLVSVSGFMTIPRTVGEYVVAFSASRTVPPEDKGPSPISFDEVAFNIGDDFNPTTGTFLCRIPGVYLFTVSAGANLTGGRSSCRLYKGNEVITRIVRHGVHGQDISETMATAVLVSLEKEDVVELKCYGVYSDCRKHITFSGVSMHPRAAFSTARSFSSAADDYNTNLLGPNDDNNGDEDSSNAILFDQTTVNIGRHFDTSSGIFLCSVPGLYHVTFSTGKRRNDHVHILLMQNDEPIASIYQMRSYVEAGNNTLESTASRSVIVDLSFGDRVYLQSVPGTSYYSSNDCEMTFSATLLNKCYYCPGITASVEPTTTTSTTTTTQATPETWQWRK